MKNFFYIFAVTILLTLSGCISKNNDNKPRVVGDKAAEEQLEKHDTYKPWWF